LTGSYTVSQTCHGTIGTVPAISSRNGANGRVNRIVASDAETISVDATTLVEVQANGKCL
jgi:hypothetical protein